MPDNPELQAAREIDALFATLVADAITSAEVWGQRGDAFSRRNHVRTAFAFVEGIIQIMKSAALLYDSSFNDPRKLTAEEITVLKEEDVQLTTSGVIKIQKMRISLLPNFQFAISAYAKVRGIEVGLDRGGEGWEHLREAIKIRDRLTHPHTVRDLEVSLEDMRIVESGIKFFRDTTAPLMLIPG